MKLTKQDLKEIRQFTKDRFPCFGMWIELGIKVFYTGEVVNGDWSGVKSDHSPNMLFPCDNQDLSDFINWHDIPCEEIIPVNGFCLLDFYVHDKEELKGNVQALVFTSMMTEENKIVKMWETWHDERELKELTGQISAFHP